MIKKILLVLMANALLIGARGADVSFKIETLKKGRAVPWGIDFISSNKMIVTERPGGIFLFDLKTKTSTPVTGGPSVTAKGQGGLLDVAVHREFAKNKTLFLTYSKRIGFGQYTTALAVAILKGNKLVNLRDLFVGNKSSSKTVHYGSRIIHSNGYLYFSVGDRGKRHWAQDLSNHAGKILRIREDGSIPEDNPFYNRPKAAKEVWSYGHRNPQGLALDKSTGNLWEQEHGPRGGDEINVIQKGANYGWPIITYGKEYWGPSIGEGTHKKGMVQPVKHYTPSIAPCGLLFYSGDKFPSWKGSLFSGALKSRYLSRLVLKGKKVIREEKLLEKLDKRIRDVVQGWEGYIYFSTDDGFLFRLVPVSPLTKKKNRSQ